VVALHHELARERELADALRGELKALRGELEATLAHLAALPKFGPVIGALAQRIQNLSLRYPRLSAATKRIARLAFQRKAA
jgi:hypothetical protein